jgi:hypothetical protein
MKNKTLLFVNQSNSFTMGVKSFKDLDSLPIEKIIRLPFFYSLKRLKPDPKQCDTCEQWEIVFRCNRLVAEGCYELLDMTSETGFIIRYKNIDFEPPDIPLVDLKPKRPK